MKIEMNFFKMLLAVGVCLIFYLGTIALLFTNIEVRKEKKTVALSKTESDYLKGIAALMVLLSHFQNFMEVNNFRFAILLKPFSLMGGMGVLLFFFLSGYGIYKGYSDKKPTFQYWTNRVRNILFPSLIISTLSCLAIDFANRGENMIGVDIIKDIFSGQWYVDVLMIECMVFFIAWVISKENQRTMIIITLLGSFIVATIFYWLNFNSRWYNGVLLFPTGMMIAYFEKRIVSLSKKKRMATLIMTLSGFIITGAIFTVLKGNLLGDFVKTFSGVCLAILVVLIISYVKVGNRCVLWIGKRSLYIYLCHLYLLELMSEIIRNKKTMLVSIDMLFYLLLVGSFVYAELMYLILSKGRKRIK